ncbi:hypothetical protein DL764_001638 [Monosporascus ibericus]|uniref:Uncharacterized protein n=1 Tax=Monosporascus ibericus TaxID=155417 RepID=A0A4Q4TNM3_9PEZI|nr:hypothetical protein DL764_001638 [Monosporascus ibericus]
MVRSLAACVNGIKMGVGVRIFVASSSPIWTPGEILLDVPQLEAMGSFEAAGGTYLHGAEPLSGFQAANW